MDKLNLKWSNEPTIQYSIETRPVSDTEVMALISRDATETGPDGIDRRTSVFTDWPDFEDDPSDYLESDGIIITDIPFEHRLTEPTKLPGYLQMREKLPLEERAALNADEWCSKAMTLDDYEGPTTLVTDTRHWLNGAIGWREAFRPMLRLLDLENKAPPTVCQGCGRAAQLTPKGLCIRCALA